MVLPWVEGGCGAGGGWWVEGELVNGDAKRRIERTSVVEGMSYLGDLVSSWKVPGMVRVRTYMV